MDVRHMYSNLMRATGLGITSYQTKSLFIGRFVLSNFFLHAHWQFQKFSFECLVFRRLMTPAELGSFYQTLKPHETTLHFVRGNGHSTLNIHGKRSAIVF